MKTHIIQQRCPQPVQVTSTLWDKQATGVSPASLKHELEENAHGIFLNKGVIRIGTRGSKLALAQTEYIAALLKEKYPCLSVEIVTMTTKGDKILDVPLAKIGGKGLFTKEIELAILNSEIDIAVHSLKDMPTELPEGLEIAAVTKRLEPRDAFVSLKYNSFSELPAGATVGTSSLRRRAQLLNLWPDITVKDLRGNVNTRLDKLKNGEYDALILAAAGLMRLGLNGYIKELLPVEQSLPAVGQGILAVEARADDRETEKLLETLNDTSAAISSQAERSFLQRIDGGCQVPVGVFAELKNDRLYLQALIASLDGKKIIRGELSGEKAEAEKLGISLADKLLSEGGREILAELV